MFETRFRMISPCSWMFRDMTPELEFFLRRKQQTPLVSSLMEPVEVVWRALEFVEIDRSLSDP